MCGIVGWWIDTPVPDAKRHASAALEAIRHRGPDGNGIFTAASGRGGQVCLAHARLSIIDLTDASAQPFHSHDGRYILSYNGEAYNFIELRDELRELGHCFVTQGDTEVVVEAYRRWGVEAFSRLRGMFALALWDRQEDRLVLARDHVGKKPLYLAQVPGGFAFSSEIAALEQVPGVDLSLDLGHMPEFLAQRFVKSPDTFYAGIHKLAPGHAMIAHEGQGEVVEFYRAPFLTTRPRPADPRTAQARFEEILDESVRLRMRSDAPFGLFLSGGMDSSTLLALMNRHSNQPVKTFTAGFAGEGPNELDAARGTARSFSADHTELVVGARAFAEHWPHCVNRRGAPVSEAADIAISLLSHEANKSVKMVLTGEGADELLGGYPKYRAEVYLKYYHRLFPAFLQRALVHPVVKNLPARYERLKILSRVSGMARATDRAPAWFASAEAGWVRRITGMQEHPGWDDPAAIAAHTPMRTLQHYDYTYWLPDNLLERGDRMMMDGSIEGRMPFMDVKLIEYVSTLPENLAVNWRHGKILLRNLAQRLLPPDLLARPKVGFIVPLTSWFRGELRPLITDLLTSEESRIGAIFDSAALHRVLGEHVSGSNDHTKLLWTLGNLELFLRRWDKSSVAASFAAAQAQPAAA